MQENYGNCEICNRNGCTKRNDNESITEDGYCLKFDKRYDTRIPHTVAFYHSDDPEIDCFDCELSCPYFSQDENPKTLELPKEDQCPHKARVNFNIKNFRDGKTADQLNIEMVQHFVKKGIADQLPKGMLEKYGGSNVR